jgi:hypothetical protein
VANVAAMRHPPTWSAKRIDLDSIGPMTVTDAKDLVKRCKGCQFFAKQHHMPAQVLRTIPPSWPFAMWGLDDVGPFRTAQGGYKHILVAVDKFTKWIEV